jgi:hypothetical protein
MAGYKKIKAATSATNIKIWPDIKKLKRPHLSIYVVDRTSILMKDFLVVCNHLLFRQLKTYKSQDMLISNQACDLLGERTFADKWGFE